MQKEALRAYCLEHGIKVDQWIEDIGSALNYKRKGFNQVIEQIELGLVKRLIILLCQSRRNRPFCLELGVS